jgi:hypothetical protein
MKGDFGTSKSAKKIPIYRRGGVYNIEGYPSKVQNLDIKLAREHTYIQGGGGIIYRRRETKSTREAFGETPQETLKKSDDRKV